MALKDFTFELLIIDATGETEITTSKNLLHGLLLTEKLWDKPKESFEGNVQGLKDGSLNLKIIPFDVSSTLYDLYESAFIINVRSQDFEVLEKLRFGLIRHLLNKLSFKNIRVLTDDVSTHISNTIYPLINEIENLLRRYLAKFFIQKVGLEWFKQAAPDKLIEKTKMRRENETIFSKMVQTDLTLIDFDDLGEIIYKHKLGFNKPENLVDQILAVQSEDELTKLKLELDSNYNRFFKQHFKDKGFDKKWKTLFSIRNKVAHNNLFTKADLDEAEQLHKELKEIISDAENSIEDFKFSLNEQEAMIQASNFEDIEGDNNSNSIDTSHSRKDHLSYFDSYYGVISEENLLKELERAQTNAKAKSYKFVGLKSFVNNILCRKGYSYSSSVAQINVLREKGLLDIYDYEDGNNLYPVKAIKLVD